MINSYEIEIVILLIFYLYRIFYITNHVTTLTNILYEINYHELFVMIYIIMDFILVYIYVMIITICFICLYFLHLNYVLIDKYVYLLFNLYLLKFQVYLIYDQNVLMMMIKMRIKGLRLVIYVWGRFIYDLLIINLSLHIIISNKYNIYIIKYKYKLCIK